MVADPVNGQAVRRRSKRELSTRRTGFGDNRPRICLFGTFPDTGNLGLSALLSAVMEGIAERRPEARVTVFDNGFGVRRGFVTTDLGDFPVRLCGARLSRRIHRRESLVNMRVSSLLGGLGNPGVEAIAEADAVLDASGGDSFTDLYGARRFRAVSLPKLLTLRERTPLVLLPQTYGPFDKASERRTAVGILRRSAMAWARDPHSYDRLAAYLGSDFDPARHRPGVDMAFLLRPADATPRLDPRLCAWLNDDRSEPIVGLNVSGLLYGQPDRFGFRANYRQVVVRLLRRLLDRTSARVLLVPHVRGAGWESDDAPAHALLRLFGDRDGDRIAIAPAGLNANETKWLIAKLDWFCGTRMHSTIAALSSMVPVSAIAYSLKTAGVFATCRVADQVVDPRSATTEETLSGLWHSWEQRDEISRRLATHVPAVIELADRQMDAIVAHVSDTGA